MSIQQPFEDNLTTLPEADQLNPGMRVLVKGNPAGLTLRSRDGWVVAPDDYWDGFYIVRLDQPALYRHADGSVEELQEIREGRENLALVTT